MSDIAIRCEGLSKQYRIGERERYKALRDVITAAAGAPFRRLRSTFKRGPSTANGASNGSRSHHSSLITHHSDRFWALDDVSFEVKPGEAVGIIGRNGAGKSTLLKILSRITKPTRGHAEIHGRVGSLLEVGTGFHPELTGRENIYLNGAILGMRKVEIDRKFDDIISFAEIEKFVDTPVKRYSSGMYVRLAFAVAAHMETEVLLVDEVLAVGDAAFQTKCLGKMGDVAKHGRTVVFVSHDMNAIQVLCQRALYLRGGTSQGIGQAAEQVIRYLSAEKITNKILSENSIVLGEKLEIHRFEFSPNPVSCNEPVDFSLEISTTSEIKLDEIAILIYSSLGRRLAILDLRKSGKTYRLNGSGESIVGTIRNVPFVEGDYHIGLYLNWGETKGDFYDLVDLSVRNDSAPGDIVPYPPGVRGVVELDYEIM